MNSVNNARPLSSDSPMPSIRARTKESHVKENTKITAAANQQLTEFGRNFSMKRGLVGAFLGFCFSVLTALIAKAENKALYNEQWQNVSNSDVLSANLPFIVITTLAIGFFASLKC